MWPLLLIMGAVLALGLAIQAGAGRRVTLHAGFPQALFAIAWLGAAGVLTAVAIGLQEADATVLRILGVVLALAAFALWALGLVFLVRMPRRLHPAWYRRYWSEAGQVADPSWSRRDSQRESPRDLPREEGR